MQWNNQLLVYFQHLCSRTVTMKKKIFLLLLLIYSANVFAGVDTVIVPIQRQLFHDRINQEQKLLDQADGKTDGIIKVSSNDEINSAVTDIMIRRINQLTDSIELNVKIATNNEKVRYLNNIENLVRAYRNGWKLKQLNPTYAALLVNNFEKVMNANIDSGSMAPYIDELPYEAGMIITEIFKENTGYAASKKILFLKYSAIHPDKIIQNIEPYVNEPFADSMVTVCSQYNPTAVYNASQATGTVIGKLIQHNTSPIVKTILEISNTSGSLKYFPFLDDLVSGKKTIDNIKKYAGNGETGYDSVGYFKLLVRTEIEYFKRMAPPLRDTPIAMFGVNGLREMLQAKAIQHFITPVNALHAQNNLNTRMRAIDSLSAVDLYYMVVLGENDIYTSSYKHSFERMLQRMGKKPRGDSLLFSVHFDYFKKFIKMAANFNKLDEFLKLMPASRSQMLMQAFVANLDKTGNLEDAVDVADAYSSINDKKLLKNILNHVIENEKVCIANNNNHGKMIYGLLKTIFLSEDSSAKTDLTKETGIPSIFSIDNKSLADDSGRIIQQHFIYGDADGKEDYNGFINSFSRTDWKVVIKDEWAEIMSLKGKKIWIYANRPLDSDTNLDDSAQVHLDKYLVQNNLHPSIVIHRGHSYWLPRTLELMPDNVKIAVLGSCGGFKNLNKILEYSPDAHIISTKEIGKTDINKPIINYINQTLLSGRPLVWKNMWSTLTRQFAAADAETRQSWEDYVSPYRNLGAIFIKAYNKKAQE